MNVKTHHYHCEVAVLIVLVRLSHCWCPIYEEQGGFNPFGSCCPFAHFLIICSLWGNGAHNGGPRPLQPPRKDIVFTNRHETAAKKKKKSSKLYLLTVRPRFTETGVVFMTILFIFWCGTGRINSLKVFTCSSSSLCINTWALERRREKTPEKKTLLC